MPASNREAVEIVQELMALVQNAQNILTQVLIGQPRGLTDKAGISALLGLLDGPRQRAAQERGSRFLAAQEDSTSE